MAGKEREVVAACRENPDGGAAVLLGRYREKLIAAIHSHFSWNPKRGSCDTSEAVVSGILQFLRQVQEKDYPITSTFGLLRTIVIRKYAQQVRRARPTSYGPEDLEQIVDSWLCDTTGSESSVEIAAILSEALELAKAGLTDLEREIIGVLTDPEKPRTTNEVASVCKCDPSTVRAAVRRFKKHLQSML